MKCFPVFNVISYHFIANTTNAAFNAEPAENPLPDEDSDDVFAAPNQSEPNTGIVKIR